MKHVNQLVISLCVMVYISFILFIFSITVKDLLKYILMFLGATILIFVCFFIMKNIKWNNKINQEITEEKKEKIKKRMTKVKKIVSFCVYSFLILFLLLGISNDGEFIVKNIYTFFKKRVSDNEIFNWIIIASPLCCLIALQNIYDAIIKIITEKYGLSEDSKD